MVGGVQAVGLKDKVQAFVNGECTPHAAVNIPCAGIAKTESLRSGRIADQILWCADRRHVLRSCERGWVNILHVTQVGGLDAVRPLSEAAVDAGVMVCVGR